MNISKELLKSLEKVPLIKDGKRGVSQLNSFHADMEMFFALKSKCEWYPENAKRYISEWNNIMQLRNDEDFCQHTESKNYLLYRSFKNWR